MIQIENISKVFRTTEVETSASLEPLAVGNPPY